MAECIIESYPLNALLTMVNYLAVSLIGSYQKYVSPQKAFAAHTVHIPVNHLALNLQEELS
jgi:hypothetical protein